MSLFIMKIRLSVLMIIFFIFFANVFVAYADISADEKKAIDQASGEVRFQYFYKTGKEWSESSYEDRQNFFKKTKEAKQAGEQQKRQLEQDKQARQQKLEERKVALQHKKQELSQRRQQLEQKRQQEMQARKQRVQQQKQRLQQRRSQFKR